MAVEKDDKGQKYDYLGEVDFTVTNQIIDGRQPFSSRYKASNQKSLIGCLL